MCAFSDNNKKKKPYSLHTLVKVRQHINIKATLKLLGCTKSVSHKFLIITLLATILCYDF